MRGKLAVILMIFISGCCGKGKIVERGGCTYYYNGCGLQTGADCADYYTEGARPPVERGGCCAAPLTRVERDGCTHYYNSSGVSVKAICVVKPEDGESGQKR